MDPVAFQLGPLEIRWYGIMMALSMMLAAALAVKLLKKYGRNGDLVWDGLVYLITAGIVGARLVYVLTNLSDYTSAPWWHVFAVWQGGLSFHGGIIAGGLATWAYFRHKGIPFLEVVDSFAPGVCLSIVLVRIGNLMNGDILGYKWDGPWAMNFANDEYHFGQPPGTVILRHPTELYGLLVGVICFAVAMWMWNNTYVRRKFAIGTTYFGFMISYSVVRSLIEEPFRAVPLVWPLTAAPKDGVAPDGFGILTMTQVVSIVLILIGIWGLSQLRKWERIRALAPPPSIKTGGPNVTRQQRRAQERKEKK
ncbi:MAG: prolipoprotein diacylglyceryl transferase [bacterium]|nr:prolipoprotein diacylglyceryl transferase [bacterium]